MEDFSIPYLRTEDICDARPWPPFCLRRDSIDTEIMRGINRQTLGTLIKNAKGRSQAVEEIAALLERALGERNRLSHSFYRRHNFRRGPGGDDAGP
jgi:hypothetical protein